MLDRTLQNWYMIAVAILLSGFSSSSLAAKVTLQWDRSPDAGVVGYRVYSRSVGVATPFVRDVGASTSVTLENLLDGVTYSIFTVAYDASGSESNPSNLVSYQVPGLPTEPPPPIPTNPVPNPVPTNSVALQFGGFLRATAHYSPHGTMSPIGELFASGTRVTLTATPDSGYMCTGWVVNSNLVTGNPVVVTMNQNTLVTPVIKKNNGAIPGAQLPILISMKVATVEGQPTISIGGELGAWVLEGSSNLTAWSQVAQGLTSEKLTMPTTAPHAFYRVRSASLSAFP